LATAESVPNTFINNDYGISVRYPKGWTTYLDEQSGVLTWFLSPKRAVYARLFVGSQESGQTLQQAALNIRQYSFTDLTDVKILSDKRIELKDGHEAWEIVVTATRMSDGEPIKMNLTTTTDGQTTYSMMAFGSPDDYDHYRKDIAALMGALHLQEKILYGIPRDRALVLLGGESTDPRDYDPATAHSGDRLVFSGLVALDSDYHVISDLAATWQVTNGTIYTFTLRSDARFHNGRPVTAQDVIYSWERAADPKTQSDTVLTYLGDIVGVKEMYAGQVEHISGLQAVDDYTLQVTIDAPKPYFLFKLTYGPALIVDRVNVESGPEWYRTPNGAGPYRLARWDRFELMLYERNDDYYLEPPAIQYVIYRLYAGDGLSLYEMGQLDVAGVSYYDVPRVSDPGNPLHADLVSSVSPCTGYVVFDTTQAPFEEPQVRQAFSLAYDRQKYLDVVQQGGGLPAVGLFPPGLPGYNPSLKGLPYDPERARQLLAESSYGGPEGLPPIIYTSGGHGSAVNGAIGALAQMWEHNLGVTLTVENLEPNKYSDKISAGHHGQLFDGGWCADYPDPENFADVLLYTGAQQNRGHYSNPQVDALLDQARTEPDVPTRIHLYQRAEQLIVDDAALLFTTHYVGYILESIQNKDSMFRNGLFCRLFMVSPAYFE
jgi:oligopeptide transport system substrate-binding protein